MPTIKEEQRAWNNPIGQRALEDTLHLTREVVGKARSSGYNLVFYNAEIIEDSEFSPLESPSTVTEAIEKYSASCKRAQNSIGHLYWGSKVIDPAFIHALEKTKEVNEHIKKIEWIRGVEKIPVTDYSNFLYLAHKTLNEVERGEEKIRKRKEKIGKTHKKIFGIPYTRPEYKIIEEKSYPSPIVVITNPQEDGLTYILELEKELLVKKKRTLKIINTGEKDCDEVQQLMEIPGSQYKNTAGIISRKKEIHCGVFSENASIEGTFSDVHRMPLFGIENEITAEYTIYKMLSECRRYAFECFFNEI